MRALNIGCGRDYRESIAGQSTWTNIDFDETVKKDLEYPLHLLHEKFEDQIDFILAQDVVEHLVYNDDWKTYWIKCLKSWYRCLKNGGKITIQVPDPYLIFELLKCGKISEKEMNRLVYGENTNKGDRHYQLISLGRLCETLKSLGFRVYEQTQINICSIVSAIKD